MKKKNAIHTVIDQQEFYNLTRPLINLPISRVWRGYGSAIFLEIGQLSQEKRTGNNGEQQIRSVGQFGVMIQWSWRIELPRSIYFGSWDSARMIDNRLPKLNNCTIVAIDIEGRLPELVVQLSNQLWVHSFATVAGQPEWCVFLDRQQLPHQWLMIKCGKLIKETAVTP